MTTPSRAAIYARISLDTEGEAKGVTRQVDDCQKLAAELGWTVADEYIDNDISAYSGKHRPEYQRMLDDIKNLTIDGVLVYSLDRLTRRPIEFETFYSVVQSAGLTNVSFVTGNMDLGNDAGLMIGRIQSAVAANQSDATSRRQKRKNDEKAAAGIPHGGYRRPFGFEDDKITHRPEEVTVIQMLAGRFLAGESLRSLASWLDQEGVRTVGGGPWRTNVIRLQLMSPRIAGLRSHRGKVVGPAVWDPIISVQQRDQILATFDERHRSGRRAPRRYLLSGLLRCSLCDHRLYSQARESTRRYVCTSGPDHGGCGKITIVAQPVEELVAEAVLYRLDTVELADALAGKGRSDADAASLMTKISADREQLETLATLHGKGEIGLTEWMAARRPVQDRMRAAERRLRKATSTTQLAGLIGHGDALRTQWASLNLDRQAAIVQALLDHADILPGARGVRSVDHRRVILAWRL